MVFACGRGPVDMFRGNNGVAPVETDDRSSPDKELARVIAIEQDFAAASLSQGIKQSFLAYAAPDAVLFRPKPVAAVTALINDPDDNDGLTLDWWPAMGAIARSRRPGPEPGHGSSKSWGNQAAALWR